MDVVRPDMDDDRAGDENRSRGDLSAGAPEDLGARSDVERKLQRPSLRRPRQTDPRHVRNVRAEKHSSTPLPAPDRLDHRPLRRHGGRARQRARVGQLTQRAAAGGPRSVEADDGIRTHDLLHGKCEQPFAPVRARSLKPAVCSAFLPSERTGANPSERRTLPSLPRSQAPNRDSTSFSATCSASSQTARRDSRLRARWRAREQRCLQALSPDKEPARTAPSARTNSASSFRCRLSAGFPTTAFLAPADSNDCTEPAESTDAAEPAEPIDSTDAAEPIEPIDRMDPTEPTESTDRSHAMESTESREASDQREATATR
jgi:hypothetical protein